MADFYQPIMTLILRITKNQKFLSSSSILNSKKKISKILIFRFSKENSLKSAKRVWTNSGKFYAVMSAFVR